MNTHSQISAQLVLASRNKSTGDTLFTFVLRYPRIIHSEFMTHRMFSKNSASSRAIPTKKMRRMVLLDPFIPIYLGANQKGMQAGADITGIRERVLKWLYGAARYPAVCAHWLMERLGLHKQITNRLLEPWMWMEVVMSATETDNFFHQRCDKQAEPHLQDLARRMRRVVELANVQIDRMIEVGKTQDIFVGGSYTKRYLADVQVLEKGEWHTPFADQYKMSIDKALITSSARCARVSYYLPEDGTLSTPERDAETYNKLVSGPVFHASPFEHVAQAAGPCFYANFKGFKQLRHMIGKT